jgi:hypothetical protein
MAWGTGIVDQAARGFVSTLMEEFARARGKTRWAEKTPDNALYVDFLLTLFPEAKCIHLVRDGLDVAVSTSVVEKHREGISGFLEKYLGLGPGVPPVDNNPFNSLLKWNHWDRLIATSLAGREHLQIRYEALAREPESTMRRVMEFIGEPFEPGMIDYASHKHEYPSWEWGSADVQARGRVTHDRIGRGERELSAIQCELLAPLAGKRGDLSGDSVQGAYSADEAKSERYRLLTAYLNGLSRPLGLGVLEGPAAWEACWLWLNGLSRVQWKGKRVVHSGGAPGARLDRRDARSRGAPLGSSDEHSTLRKLGRDLHVKVNWSSLNEPLLPAHAIIRVGAPPHELSLEPAGFTPSRRAHPQPGVP